MITKHVIHPGSTRDGVAARTAYYPILPITRIDDIVTARGCRRVRAPGLCHYAA